MKLNKLFTFTLAALALGACSNDDDLNGGTNPEAGKGELVDAISIAFANSSTVTRANMGEIEGTGSENAVYVAYVFAKENDPQHEGKKVGDWTVKRVAGDANEKDAAVTTAIKAGDAATPGSKANMCTFNGVQQGDSVYVIVNDPNLDMATANKIAHQGEGSQASIRSYVSSLGKDYLNGLSVAKDGSQTGKFIMAGAAAIPTNPNTPNGGTVRVPVSLDREVSKVFFNASVTTDSQYEAYQKIEIKDNAVAGEGDGLVIVRIPRRVSPFTTQVRDWYFPLSGDAATKDWNVTDWKNAFNGEGETAPGVAEATPAKAFNSVPLQETAREYRLTWKVLDEAIKAPATPTSKAYISEGTLISPYFYVTPNYSNHSGCGTVIVTQATYTGTKTLLEPTVTDEMLTAAGKDVTFQGAVSAPGAMTLADVKALDWGTTANLDALVAFLGSKEEYKSVLGGYEKEDEKDKAADFISIKQGQKRYYRADVANMTSDNATSMKLTERNTFYHITGTITTLGARSIEDAINSDDINMIVQVVVKKWNYVVNKVNM